MNCMEAAKNFKERKLKAFQTVLIMGSLFLAAQSATAADSAIDGIWKMGNGKLVVKVEHCSVDRICVKIANIAKAFHNDGTPRLDDNNPDPSLRKRPVVGLEIISGMAATGSNTWKGRLYNSDDGHTYTAYAKLSGNALEVKGCWGPFCKKLNFAR
jgi:uncharacterized protein (DUF2147 family)